MIKRLNTPFFPLFIAALLVFSCTTKKDGVAYRVYHNTTTHFNGHFNADQAMVQAQKTIESAFQEDYDSIIPILICGNPELNKAAYEDLEKVISKSEKVIKKHTITGEEKKSIRFPIYNKWIDENYILLGQANYYKGQFNVSEKLFSYVANKYQEPNAQVSGTAWLARNFIADHESSKAILTLAKEELGNKKISPSTRAYYYAVLAEAQIQNFEFEKAIPPLNNAILFEKNKSKKARLLFVKAQILEKQSKFNEAQIAYSLVIKNKPDPELALHSKLKKSINAVNLGGSSSAAKAELLKMISDVKYANYKDQIYFTLGIIAKKEAEFSDAITFFQKSIKESKNNNSIKGKAYLIIADIQFQEKNYIRAQSAYDSTQKLIHENHPRYEEVKGRAKSLTELVGYLNQIALGDSIEKICQLTLEEQMKSFELHRQKLINLEIEKEQEEARLAAEKQTEMLESGNGGNFWCYNKDSRDKGFKEFRNKWEDRPLKDNWRLQAKLNLISSLPDERPGESDVQSTSQAENVESSIPSVEELIKDLPCSNDSMLLLIKDKQLEGYYKAAIVYKEDLNDVQEASFLWEKLSSLGENAYSPLALYQLFRLWALQEQLGNKGLSTCSTCSSQFWVKEIKARYPNSDWSRFVDNPEAKDNKEQKLENEKDAYEKTYKLYLSRNYPDAMTACRNEIESNPQNHLICKFQLLLSICTGYTEKMAGSTELFKKELEKTILNCPDSPEKDIAKSMLDALNPSNTETSPIKDSLNKPAEQLLISQVNYSFDQNAEYYFALVVPLKTPKINEIRALVNDYANKNYASNKLSVTGNMLNTESQLIMVKSFKKLLDAKAFMTTFAQDQSDLKSINDMHFTSFIISKSNYVLLFKAREWQSYWSFYQENY